MPGMLCVLMQEAHKNCWIVGHRTHYFPWCLCRSVWSGCTTDTDTTEDDDPYRFTSDEFDDDDLAPEVGSK
jgi:hypothetical protein